jgi:hypothetical protein
MGRMRQTLTVDTLNQYLNMFKVDGSFIKKIGSNGSWHKILINEVIQRNRVYRFKVKVVNTQNRYIMIGTVDRLKGRSNQYSQNQEYALCYYGNGGSVFPGSTVQGGGFKSGDTV